MSELMSACRSCMASIIAILEEDVVFSLPHARQVSNVGIFRLNSIFCANCLLSSACAHASKVLNVAFVIPFFSFLLIHPDKQLSNTFRRNVTSRTPPSGSRNSSRRAFPLRPIWQPRRTVSTTCSPSCHTALASLCSTGTYLNLESCSTAALQGADKKGVYVACVLVFVMHLCLCLCRLLQRDQHDHPCLFVFVMLARSCLCRLLQQPCRTEEDIERGMAGAAAAFKRACPSRP